MANDALTANVHDEPGISKITTARSVQAALTSALTFSVGPAMPLLMVVVSPASALFPIGSRGVFGLSRSSGCDRGKNGRSKHSARPGPREILGRLGDGAHRRNR